MSWLPLLQGAGPYLHDPFYVITQNPDLENGTDWEITKQGDISFGTSGLDNQGIIWPNNLDVWGDLTSNEFALYIELFIKSWSSDGFGNIIQHSAATTNNLNIYYEQGQNGIRFRRSNNIGTPSTNRQTFAPNTLTVDSRRHQWLFQQRDGQGSHLCFSQDGGLIEVFTDSQYIGSVPGAKPLCFLIRSNKSWEADATLLQVRLFNKWLDDSRIEALFDDPWGAFDPVIWIPTEAPGPPQPIALNIENLRHGRLVDDVNVTVEAVDIQIDALRHGRPVDPVPALGVSVNLFLASLRHARAVDDLDVVVSVDLSIDHLRHWQRVDAVDLQELVGVVIDIENARHGRPIDQLLFDVEQPILIDGLRHGRPVDVVDVQMLMGDQTGIGATAAAWVLDAGQSLNNASSIDFGYHVLEGVFDGNQSVLGVDGARVTGPAGMRELTALTLGADVDGQRRTHGEIAELRIYAGALSQADRDRITQELTTKWITG